MGGRFGSKQARKPTSFRDNKSSSDRSGLSGSPWEFIAACLIVTGIVCFVYGPVLFAPPGHAPATTFHDFFSLNYPSAWIGRELAEQGSFPTWNPFTFGGMPFLASIQMGALYPPNWLHAILPPERVFCLLLVGHVLFAGLGTWLYCRGRGLAPEAALLAAMVFAMSGRVVLHQFAGHPQIAYSAAWLPFVFWVVDRLLRNPSPLTASGLAITLCFQFLVGWPMFSLLLAFALPPYVLLVGSPAGDGKRWSWRTLAWLGVSVVLAIGLVSPQILPTLEYMRESHRGQGLAYDWATTSSYPPANLLTFLVPGFFGDEVNAAYWGETSIWECTAFCGVTTLLLALLGFVACRSERTWRYWALVGLVAMLIAMGRYSFVYDAFYAYMPGWRLFRGIGKLSVFVTLALAILAARGFAGVFCGSKSLPRIGRIVCWSGLVLSLVAIGLSCFERSIDAPAPQWWGEFVAWVRPPGRHGLLPLANPLPEPFLAESYNFALARIAVSGLILGGGCLIVLASSRFPRAAGLGLLTLMGAELSMFASPYLRTSDATIRQQPSHAVHRVLGDRSSERFCCVTPDDDELLNQFVYDGFREPGGVEASLLKRYTQLIQAFTGIDPQLQTYLSFPGVHGPLFNFLGVRFYAAPEEAPRIGDVSADRIIQRQVFQKSGRSYDLYENPDALPQAFLVHRARSIEYPDAAVVLLPALLRDGVERATFVEGVLDVQPEEPTEAELATESCVIEPSVATRQRFSVTLAKPGLLLVNENWYPGWVASIDGQPATVLPANLVMRAVAIPAGQHTVEMRFESKSFRQGGLIAAVSAVATIVLLLTGLVRRPQSPQVAATAIQAVSPSSRQATNSATTLWWRISGPCYYGSLTLLLLAAGGWAFQVLMEPALPAGERFPLRLWMGIATVLLCVPVVVSGRVLAAANRTRWQAGNILFGIVLVITLATAEFAARLVVPSWPTLGLHGVEPQVGGKAWTPIVRKSESIGLNSWGQRDRERTIKPANDVLRIAFIGDSFLEESTTTPLSVRVEDLLAQQNVEVVNLGVSASSPDEYFDRLQQIALPLGASHCVVFVYAGNDFVESGRTLRSWGGVAAVYPRRSLMTSIGLFGVNHLLTNRQRPVLRAWLTAGDLRRDEEYRRLVLSEVDAANLPALLLSVAQVPQEQEEQLRARLQAPEMAGVYEMLKAPDGGQFRSYYLSQALTAAMDPSWQWDENSEREALHWLTLASHACRKNDARFSVVIIPEGCQVDPRMAEQWRPLADMRRVTQATRDASMRLRRKLEAANIDVIDLHDGLQDLPGTYLNVDGHWSDLGVEKVAEILAKHLSHTQPGNR